MLWEKFKLWRWGEQIDRFHGHVFISFATGKLEGGTLFFVYLFGVCVCVCPSVCVHPRRSSLPPFLIESFVMYRILLNGTFLCG